MGLTESGVLLSAVVGIHSINLVLGALELTGLLRRGKVIEEAKLDTVLGVMIDSLFCLILDLILMKMRVLSRVKGWISGFFEYFGIDSPKLVTFTLYSIVIVVMRRIGTPMFPVLMILTLIFAAIFLNISERYSATIPKAALSAGLLVATIYLTGVGLIKSVLKLIAKPAANNEKFKPMIKEIREAVGKDAVGNVYIMPENTGSFCWRPTFEKNLYFRSDTLDKCSRDEAVVLALREVGYSQYKYDIVGIAVIVLMLLIIFMICAWFISNTSIAKGFTKSDNPSKPLLFLIFSLIVLPALGMAARVIFQITMRQFEYGQDQFVVSLGHKYGETLLGLLKKDSKSTPAPPSLFHRLFSEVSKAERIWRIGRMMGMKTPRAEGQQ